MKRFDPFAALALPDSALVDRRVPKSLLEENGTPTAADKRHIREGIEEVRWVAALKPTTIGVDVYRDSVREYLELAVLKLILRSRVGADRITELVHRAVPYPVLLIAWEGDTPELSLAHTRWSQGEAGKTVIDGEVIAVRPLDGYAEELSCAFSDALALTRQPRSTLRTLYQGWIDVVHSLRAARVTGVFSIPTSPMEAADRAAALREYRNLDARIADLRAAAKKEKQISRRVEMNLELGRLGIDRAAARVRL